MSLAAEKANDPLLVSRSKACEKRCLFRGIRQFRVRHLLDGLAQPLRLEQVSEATVAAVAQSIIVCVLIDALFIIIYLTT